MLILRRLPPFSLLTDIPSMEQEIDCKILPDNSETAFVRFKRKTIIMRTILNTVALGVLLIPFAARSSDPSAPTQRLPQFENSHVKVWKSTIAPNAPLALHRHDHGRVIIVVQGGTMKIKDRSGTFEKHIWET